MIELKNLLINFAIDLAKCLKFGQVFKKYNLIGTFGNRVVV